MEIKYSEDKKVLIKATDISGDFIIPDGVERIEEKAFWDCKGLTSISIPSSVKSIGDLAFYGCSGLRAIKILGNVESIEKDAFHGCEGCTLYVPSGMKSKYKNHPKFSMFKDIVEMESETESLT